MKKRHKVKKILNLRIGKYPLKLILALFVFIFLICFIFKFITNAFSKDAKIPNYPIVYLNANDEVLIQKSNSKKTFKLSNNDDVNVKYANKTDRYVLFTRENNLYLYDYHHKKEIKKIANNIYNDFGFSQNDKYIYYINNNRELYAYNNKEIKIDNDVNKIYYVSNDKIFYGKISSNAIYYRNLKGNKDRVEIGNNINSIYVNEKGNKALYLNSDGDLYYYKVNSKKSTKIADDVYKIIDIKDDLTKAFYQKTNKEIYYLKNKKSKKLIESANTIYYTDLDNLQIIYDNDSKLYYQKSNKKPIYITESSLVRNAYIYNKKELYYIKRDNNYVLYYAKISGSKLKNHDIILDNINTEAVNDYKKGFVILSNVYATGDLNIINKGKVTKIASSVNADSVKVSNDQKILYFISDYSNNSGTLMYTKNKKGKKILNDVSDYHYIKNNLIYIITGYSSSTNKFDIRRYNGHSSKTLVNDIKDVASVGI